MDTNKIIDETFAKMLAAKSGQDDAAALVEVNLEEPSDSTSSVEDTGDEDLEDIDLDSEVGGDNGEGSEEEETSDTTVRTIDPDDLIVYKGKEMKASDAFEMQADYTRKNQALSEKEKLVEELESKAREYYSELENWQRTRVENPYDYILEEVAVARGLTPEQFVAQLIITANNQGLLPTIYADFELERKEGFQKVAKSAVDTERLARVEQTQKALLDEKNKEVADRELAAQIESEFVNIQKANGLSFSTQEEFYNFRAELFEYAAELTEQSGADLPLDVVYKVFEADRAKKAEQAQKDTLDNETAAKRRQAIEAKKRASKLVNKPATTTEHSSPVTTYANTDDAVDAMWAAIQARQKK